jgi:hypothetical protein
MNTERKPVRVYVGRRCDHTFLRVGDVAVRSARPLVPNIDPETGREYKGDCPFPRCDTKRER